MPQLPAAQIGLVRGFLVFTLLALLSALGCSEPICGDKILDAGEECDDGNETTADAGDVPIF